MIYGQKLKSNESDTFDGFNQRFVLTFFFSYCVPTLWVYFFRSLVFFSCLFWSISYLEIVLCPLHWCQFNISRQLCVIIIWCFTVCWVISIFIDASLYVESRRVSFHPFALYTDIDRYQWKWKETTTSSKKNWHKSIHIDWHQIQLHIYTILFRFISLNSSCA